jgi:iron complex outermembrane recepter protein
VFDAPSGKTKIAVGAQYRRESYDSQGTRDTILGQKVRTVDAAFVELFVPLVAHANGFPGARSLELSVAGRYEHYSDFGATTNPKIGLSWSPVSSLKARGTWGTAFRAPLLSELDNSRSRVFAYPFPDVPGSTPTIYLSGGNPLLGPEKATTWTSGLDFSPATFPSMEMGLTYFSIHFKDRIGSPIPSTSVFGVLRNEGPYRAFITRKPPLALVNQLFNSPTLSNPVGLSAGSIGAIIDNNLANVAARDERGIDMTITNNVETAVGRFDATASATYLTKMEDKVLPGTLPISLANTLFYPIKFRMRDSIGWSRGGLSTTAFVNYSGRYTNNVVKPSQEIASLTTIDLNIRYNIGSNVNSDAMRNIVVSFSLLNAFDRGPPFVTAASGSSVTFDAANATPLGRFASLEASKSW